MTTFLIILILLVIISELSAIYVYGFYIDKKALDYFNKHRNTYWINIYDKKILTSLTAKFISNLPLPIFCKYYIEDIGMVVRWSKAHKEIEQLFKELKQKP